MNWKSFVSVISLGILLALLILGALGFWAYRALPNASASWISNQASKRSDGRVVVESLKIQPQWKELLHHKVDIKIDTHLRLQGHASLQYQGSVINTQGEWRFAWERLRLTLPDGQVWDAMPGYASMRTGHINVPQFQMAHKRSEIRLEEARLDDGQLKMLVRFRRVALGPWAQWMKPDLLLEGMANGTLRAHGPLSAPEGTLELTISSGSIKGLAFQDIHVEGELSPLDLRLQTVEIDPRLLMNFIAGLNVEPGGTLRLNARVYGKYPELNYEGHLIAALPAARYEEAGLELKDVILDVEGHDQQWNIKRAEGRLGKGTWNFSGECVKSKLNILGVARNVSLKIPKRLDVEADADLKLSGTLHAAKLTGDIRPKEGTYTTLKKKKKDAENPARSPPAMWIAMTVDVSAEWGHGLWYRDRLTKIETGGDLRILKDSGERSARVVGPVTLVRGSYDAYGKDFDIESGELRFVGTPDNNPQLNIQAEYRDRKMEIRLLVLGTAKQPELKFTSSPPMTEQEILTALVTGDPSETDKQGQEMAADVASDYLTKSLRESGMNMGLDVVRVVPTPTGSIWTVGKYINSDLYVSYGQSPKDAASSIVNAEYFLTRRWSISTQASSASDNYVDFLFRYPIKDR